MAIESKWQLCAVQINSAVIGQITAQDIGAAFTENLAAPSTSIYTTFGGFSRQQHNLTFATEQVDALWTAVGLAGAALSTNNVTCYFKSLSNEAGIAAAGCVTFAATKGIIVIRGVEAPADGNATATAEVIPVSSSGITACWTKATGVAVPTPTADEVFVVGGDGVESWSIDTGITLDLDGDAGTYNTFVAIDNITPTVSETEFAMGDVGTDTIGSVTLDKLTAGGGRTAAQWTATLNEELTQVSSLGSRTMLEARALYDGSNLPLVIS